MGFAIHNKITKRISKTDNQSIQHTRWNCTYHHVVFIPTYHKKMIYGTVKRDIVEILRKICETKGVALIEGNACVDHVHRYVAIPPKICVSEFMAYLIGIQNYGRNGTTGIYGQEGNVTTVGNL